MIIRQKGMLNIFQILSCIVIDSPLLLSLSDISEGQKLQIFVGRPHTFCLINYLDVWRCTPIDYSRFRDVSVAPQLPKLLLVESYLL